MMAISRGLTLVQVVDDPCVLTIISVNSPRRFDKAMSDGRWRWPNTASRR